jgi:chromosome segregation ATPase
MKLALEHIQHSIAVTERSLADSRNAMSTARHQFEEHEAAVKYKEATLRDLTAALALLRANAPEIPQQIVKSQPAKAVRKGA